MHPKHVRYQAALRPDITIADFEMGMRALHFVSSLFISSEQELLKKSGNLKPTIRNPQFAMIALFVGPEE